MSKEHVTYRVIDGVRCRCRDIGADNFDRAEFNRYLVANKTFSAYWIEMSQAIQRTPLSQPLPLWIPLGSISQVSKKEWQQYNGGQKGGYITDNDEVVNT